MIILFITNKIVKSIFLIPFIINYEQIGLFNIKEFINYIQYFNEN